MSNVVSTEDANEVLGTIKSLFGTNRDKEKNGIVLKFGDLHVRIARVGGGNDRFKKISEEVWRPFRAMIDAGVNLPEGVTLATVHEAYAEAVVLEWGKEVTDESTGEKTYKELPYSVDLCVRAFKESPDFFTFVVKEAGKAENFRDKQIADDSKN